eukprot:m.118350 g.118350  ORF g.118350 m.118350 type:complete len:234 (-) comp17205_c0_seq2:463-1164(-)
MCMSHRRVVMVHRYVKLCSVLCFPVTFEAEGNRMVERDGTRTFEFLRTRKCVATTRCPFCVDYRSCCDSRAMSYKVFFALLRFGYFIVAAITKCQQSSRPWVIAKKLPWYSHAFEIDIRVALKFSTWLEVIPSKNHDPQLTPLLWKQVLYTFEAQAEGTQISVKEGETLTVVQSGPEWSWVCNAHGVEGIVSVMPGDGNNVLQFHWVISTVAHGSCTNENDVRTHCAHTCTSC